MTKVPKSRDLNRTDREIVRQLTADGRLTNQELAQRIHASESTTSRHRRRLEETGVIPRYTAVVDEVSLGESECVFMLVALRSQNNADKEAFEKAL